MTTSAASREPPAPAVGVVGLRLACALPTAFLAAFLTAFLAALFTSGCTRPPATTGEPTVVNFAATDGGVVEADDYRGGDVAVLLVHGARFTKESWTPQAVELSRMGYRVLSINLRERGGSHGPQPTAPNGWTGLHHDVLGAAAHLRSTGARLVFAVGGSLGGHAVAESAAIDSTAFDGIVVLGAVPEVDPQTLRLPKLYIMAGRDVSGAGPRLPPLLDHFGRLPHPKSLLVLDGAAHAQHIFDTSEGPRVLREIAAFVGTDAHVSAGQSSMIVSQVRGFMDRYFAAIERGDAVEIAAHYAPDGATRFLNGRRRVSTRAELEATYGGPRWVAPRRIEWASVDIDPLSATHAVVSGTINWYNNDSTPPMVITYSAVVDPMSGIEFEHETFARE